MEHNLKKNDVCPADFVLLMLSSKWTLPIIRELSKGTQRPSEITATLQTISAKTLTQRLRELEQLEIVKRTAYEEIPPRVVYSLTERGKDLVFVIDALNEVGASWQKTVFANEKPTVPHCQHCYIQISDATPEDSNQVDEPAIGKEFKSEKEEAADRLEKLIERSKEWAIQESQASSSVS